jgi:hypothetical protein
VAADADLRTELLALADPLRAHGGETPPADAERLWAILDDYECWPGRHLVDDDGATAAWVVAQHARSDPGLQHRCLELLEVAVACGDAPPEHYAYLDDCVRMADGRDQRYGSQFVRSADGSTVVPWPIEDPDHVDDRRARIGLPPLAEQAATMRAQYGRRFG